MGARELPAQGAVARVTAFRIALVIGTIALVVAIVRGRRTAPSVPTAD